MNLSVFTVRCTTCVNNNKTALPDKEIESEDEVVVSGVDYIAQSLAGMDRCSSTSIARRYKGNPQSV
jgi:hypothetical protein